MPGHYTERNFEDHIEEHLLALATTSACPATTTKRSALSPQNSSPSSRPASPRRTSS